MKVVDHHGTRLATEAFGQQGDPVLLLIMGATASMLGWPDELCRRLAGLGFHVIRFDHRDTGGSTTVPPGRAEYAVEDMAGDALAVLDAYGAEEAHIVGMSLGGYIAQMLAVAHPERVCSLTLIASEPLGWDEEPLPHISQAFLDHFGSLGSLDWSKRDAVADFLVESERLCSGSGAPIDETRARDRVDLVMSRTTSIASMYNHGTVAAKADWAGRYRDIRCPVLVVHGAEDPILPIENGRALKDGIPGASLLVLDKTGHEIPDRHLSNVSERIADHARNIPCGKREAPQEPEGQSQ